ncbi:hypothetical protein HYY71_06020 [Candidatus Woesearchaeota archaeon]|nr:hypothetical protein [Candidatus Woesearchaeota archaeon]
MGMMRIGHDGRNLVCRSCLERKPVQKQEYAAAPAKAQKQQDTLMKEYFCRECKYSFKRAKHLIISACPYCGSSGSIMVKGSTARIIADASRMKGDY